MVSDRFSAGYCVDRSFSRQKIVKGKYADAINNPSRSPIALAGEQRMIYIITLSIGAEPFGGKNAPLNKIEH